MQLMAKKRSTEAAGDRHKPRQPIFLPPRLYAQLKALAEQNDRPISWEARRIVEQALREAGLWPPPPDA
jgi:hypothetical protein